ncbi:MAG: hypothetical protein KAU14_08315 [Thermoplasmata archaeon]|nr:hypothetical protein [Thermoplasmata archaeon]
MKAYMNILLTIAITGLLILVLPGDLQWAKAEDSGGTDGDEPKIDGNAGGGFDWNEVHGFVITEDGTKVCSESSDITFNVTICKDRPKWRKAEGDDEEKFHPAGYIFGELRGIHWDEQPEPYIPISREDFDKYKDDEVNLTVYILGEYTREGPSGDELRQAYKEVLVQRPNHAPFAVPWVVDCDAEEKGNWNGWRNVTDMRPEEVNEDGEMVYYIDAEGQSVKFYLNASESWDPDGDNITEYAWDLDGNRQFGEESRERKMNTTWHLGKGHHTLGLMVGDGNKYSQIVDIKFFIRIPIPYPDLIVDDISIVNLNGLDIFEKGDRANIIAYVKNLGDKESSGSFDVYLEYRFVDTNGGYEYLGTARVTETISVNGILLIECQWDTGSDEFIPGNYSFRATADVNEEVDEQDEHNNYFESYEITLEPKPGEGTPDLSIQDVLVSADTARVNEIVYLNITIRNDGDGEARYVDIYYYINSEFQYYATIDNIAAEGGEETYHFVFLGDTKGTFKIKFEVKDDGKLIETSDTYTINVWESFYPFEPPNLTIINPQDNSKVKGKVTISGTASSNVGILKVEYRLTGTEEWLQANGTTTWSIEWNTTELEDGKYTLEFRAYDGNQYSEIKTLTIKANNQKDSSDPFYEEIGLVTLIGIIGIAAVVLVVGLVTVKKKKEKSKDLTQSPVPSSSAIPGQFPPPAQPPYQQPTQPPQFQQAQPTKQAPPEQFGQQQTSPVPFMQPQQPQSVQQVIQHPQTFAPPPAPSGIPLQSNGIWYCPQCGEKAKKDYKFCMYCGFRKPN